MVKETAVPAVSIIMNCLNGEKYLREAIDSAYNQTFKDWEIIFWDNASTDSSAEIARSYDGKLRYFRSSETTTLSKARNWALEKARSKYIAFLDCDDMWLPSKLEYEVPLLDVEDEAVLVYGNFYRIFPDGKKTLALKGGQPEGEVFEKFLYNYPVGMLTALIRSSAIDKTGYGFDESLKIAEDYDLFLRLVFNGRARYMPDPVAIYRMHDTRRTLAYKDRYADECEYVIGKFRNRYEDFSARYAGALKHFNGQMDRLRAKIAMSKNDPRAARNYLKPHRWDDPSLFLLYFMTFLPPSVCNKLYNAKNKGFIF